MVIETPDELNPLLFEADDKIPEAEYGLCNSTGLSHNAG